MGPPVCFGDESVIIVKKRVAGISESMMDRFVARAARAAGVRGTVNVLVTTNRELQSLNRRFRGKDQPTDVLSFPAAVTLPEKFAGDIAISAEMAACNSKKLGHTTAEELKILALHGLLHLAGYDHEHDRGAMARKEERLRRALRLPAALIKRSEVGLRGTTGSGRGKAARTSRARPR
jgi:probable rRNA maturation factor